MGSGDVHCVECITVTHNISYFQTLYFDKCIDIIHVQKMGFHSVKLPDLAQITNSESDVYSMTSVALLTWRAVQVDSSSLYPRPDNTSISQTCRAR